MLAGLRLRVFQALGKRAQPPVSCAHAGAWHRIQVAQLVGCDPVAIGKRARALRCHAPKLAHGCGSGPRGLGEVFPWSLANAPASAGAGCQVGRGRRGPLPLLAGWGLRSFRSARRRSAISGSAVAGGQSVAPLAPLSGGVGARTGAASTRRALGSRFAKRLARSPLHLIGARAFSEVESVCVCVCVWECFRRCS